MDSHAYELICLVIVWYGLLVCEFVSRLRIYGRI